MSTYATIAAKADVVPRAGDCRSHYLWGDLELKRKHEPSSERGLSDGSFG